MPNIKSTILGILSGRQVGLSFGELIEELESHGDVAPSAVRQALRELEEERMAVSFPDPREGPGRPRYLYRGVSPDLLDQRPMITRDAVEQKRENESDYQLLRELIKDSTGVLAVLPRAEEDRIYLDAAKRLLNEDPADLFFRFGVFLQESHKKHVDLLKKSKSKSESEHYRSIVQKIETLAEQIFDRMLGIPPRIRDEQTNTLVDGPYRLHFTKNMTDDSTFQKNDFQKSLKQSILGKTLERVSVRSPTPPINLGGSDASLQPIDISTVLPWQTESREINVVTAVGVRYDIFKDAKEIDRYPDPRVLAQYERRQAIAEGLLIPPPGTLGFEEEFESRVKEAAMDLRQYVKDYEMMFIKEPPAKVHFRDGRIFPLEHRLYDALQPFLHGELVRYALKSFRNIVNAVGAESGSMIYCGFVKRPGIRIMAPLFFWYIGFGSAENDGTAIFPEMTVDDFLFKTPDTDSIVMNRLFAALLKIDGGGTYVSFRLLRRFQWLEEENVRNFPTSMDTAVWQQRLAPVAKNTLGYDPDNTGLDLVASLCARAVVLEFYSSIPRQPLDPGYERSVMVPRIECLVPFPDLVSSSDRRPIEEKEKEYVGRILDVMFYPGVMDYYPDSLTPFETGSPRVFLAPKPVIESHVSSKLIAQVYRDDFLDLLIREAKFYWLTLRDVSRSSTAAKP